MSSPVIAIPGRRFETEPPKGVTNPDDRLTQVLGTTRAIGNFVTLNGGAPLAILPGTPIDVQLALLEHADGLLFSGGGDLDLALSKSANTPDNPQAESLMPILPERDHDEKRILERGLDLGMPILGICRGMQLINVTMNDGTLYYIDHINDDPDDVSHLDVSAPANHTNEVELFSGTELSDEIIRASSSHIIEMASAHHMAIARPGEGLIVAGRSIGKTRIVKFLTSKDGNVLGVQGHPEFQLEAPYSRAIGGLLMRHAAEYHQNKTFMMQR